jgi:hypothetical protein
MGGQRNVADAPPISAYGFDQSLTNFEGMGPSFFLSPSSQDRTPKNQAVFGDMRKFLEKVYGGCNAQK